MVWSHQTPPDAAYWRRLCPWMHVADAAWCANTGTPPQPPPAPPSSASATVAGQMPPVTADDKRRLLREGYTKLTDVIRPEAADALARAVVALQAAGWPASFVMVYDEAWALARRVDERMVSLARGNANNGDMLAWFIDPNANQAGFSPHRDRQPDDVAASFHLADGHEDDDDEDKIDCNNNSQPKLFPRYSTAWVALTDATPENSCLYVVPAHHDPGYHAPGDLDDVDPLQRCLSTKEAYQNIRALPADRGEGIFFSHRILHWGSRGRTGYSTPRIALSVACADDSFEPCYFDRACLPFPDLTLRTALVCGQMIA